MGSKEVKMPQRYATVSECAEHYKVSRQMIHKLMKKGSLGRCRLTDTPRGQVWLIPYPFKRKGFDGE